MADKVVADEVVADEVVDSGTVSSERACWFLISGWEVFVVGVRLGREMWSAGVVLSW